eukprot:4049937-Pyramimonas_sp.AAC.1
MAPWHLGLGPFDLRGKQAVLEPGRAIISHLSGVCRPGISRAYVCPEVDVGPNQSNTDAFCAL